MNLVFSSLTIRSLRAEGGRRGASDNASSAVCVYWGMTSLTLITPVVTNSPFETRERGSPTMGYVAIAA